MQPSRMCELELVKLDIVSGNIKSGNIKDVTSPSVVIWCIFSFKLICVLYVQNILKLFILFIFHRYIHFVRLVVNRHIKSLLNSYVSICILKWINVFFIVKMFYQTQIENVCMILNVDYKHWAVTSNSILALSN